MKSIDPVTFELIKNNLDIIVDEMTLAMVRTAYSPNIRDAMDFSTAVCDAKGQMIAQGVCIALHLGSFPDAIEGVRRKFNMDTKPGDVFIMNDPYTGGMHLPDVFVFKPLFVDDTLLAYLVIVGDQLDVGGRVPGSRPVDTTEVFQEGLRIPPLKLYEGGRPVQAIWDMIAQNVRVPDKVIGDLRGFLSAIYSAENLLRVSVKTFGLDVILNYFQEIMNRTERLTRQTIRAIPDGHYEFADYLDDAVTVDHPVKIQVAMDVRGDELDFDLEGTSPQVPAAINSTFSFTKSSIYAAVRTVMPNDLPNNSGFFRPINIKAPLGTILNPREPAPVASRGVTGFRLVDAVLGALAQAVPERVPAAGEGGATSLRLGGHDDKVGPFVVFDSVSGTRGARPDRDGIDGCSNFAGNTANMPTEVIEADFPVRIRRYGFRADSGGPGKYRGGLGLEREWEVLSNDVLLTVRADRTKFPPWGLRGGKSGALSRNLLNPQSEARVLPAKTHYRLTAGDRFLHLQAGGGGYGNPLERDPELVLWDWRNGKITTEHARKEYGVSIREADHAIDYEATRRLRQKLRHNVGPLP